MTPAEIPYQIRKYFPQLLIRFEEFIHRNLVWADRENEDSSIDKAHFYYDTMPQELEAEKLDVDRRLNACVHEYFSKYVAYDQPSTHWEEHSASRGPRESLFLLLEMLDHFSLPSP